MLIETRAGLITCTDGTKNPLRSDNEGSLIVSESHGKYYEASRNNKLKYSYCAARATSLPATSMIGNIVWNPPGSGINLSMAKWSIILHVTSAATVGITACYAAQAITPTTATVADSYGSCYLNAGSPANMKAKAYAIGTLLVVPTVVIPLFHNTAAIATTGVDRMTGDFEGMFTVPPGHLFCLAALGAAVAAAGMTSTLTWEEVP
jgi:hypothetical protein